MKFSEKLKKIRVDNNLTQDELASKLYVTRTAISKWENDKGYPSIDSLKLISETFHITLDELISDEDIENQKLKDEKLAKKYYYIAIVSFFIAVTLVLSAYFTDIKYLLIGSFIFVIIYVLFSYFSTAKYKRKERQKNMVKFVLSKVIAYIIVIMVIIISIIEMFRWFIV